MWSSSLSAVSLAPRTTRGDPSGERNVGVSRRRLRIPELVGSEVRWLALVKLASLLLVETPYLLAYARANRGGWLFHRHALVVALFLVFAMMVRESTITAFWPIHDQR